MRRAHHRHKEQILTQSDPAKIRETDNAIVLKQGDLVLLSQAGGDIPFGLPHGYGLFFHDCRFLDGFEMRIDGQRPIVLSDVARRGFETRHVLTNPVLGRRGRTIRTNRLAIERTRLARGDVVYERQRVRNFGQRPVQARLELRFRARFNDVFTVKGFMQRPRGRLHPPRVRRRDTLCLSYRGRDGTTRALDVVFTPAPTRLAGDRALFAVALSPGSSVELGMTLAPRIETADDDARGDAGRHDAPPRAVKRGLEREERAWLESWAGLRSSSVLFDRVLQRGLLDLRILRSRLDGCGFFAAGVPWFVTLFGRDSATVALQTLAFGTNIARETLRLLARYQARMTDEYRDAEPGKILHEFRDGELAHVGAIPQSPAYYGSVDATMLFLILIAEYVSWSGDVALARELRPNIELALGWMGGPADSDGDGYLDYRGRYANGLVNQGWKDSGNAIVNADGSLPEPPIALCEVQGYAYRAWRQTATLLHHLGDAPRAADVEQRAERLHERFARDYWDPTLGGYILARQRDGRPCAVMSSNAGQVLWSGIPRAEHARRLTRRLLADDMFCGWGIRTLSSEAASYNPMSYHLGSVWPHDNALILGGLVRYGFVAEALRLFDAVFDAATRFPHYRLPELYCGFSRAESPLQPVRYPVACSPQAWAAGALPYALWTLLGLQPDALSRRLRIVRPRLPRKLDWLELTNVRVGDARVDLRWEQGSAGRVTATWKLRHGHLEIEHIDDPHLLDRCCQMSYPAITR